MENAVQTDTNQDTDLEATKIEKEAPTGKKLTIQTLRRVEGLLTRAFRALSDLNDSVYRPDLKATKDLILSVGGKKMSVSLDLTLDTDFENELTVVADGETSTIDSGMEGEHSVEERAEAQPLN